MIIIKFRCRLFNSPIIRYRNIAWVHHRFIRALITTRSQYAVPIKQCGKHITANTLSIFKCNRFFMCAPTKIYFITKDFSPVLKDNGTIENETTSVVMDKSEHGIVTYETISDSDENGPEMKAKPFKEVGIKNALKFEKIFSLLGIGILVDTAKKSLDGGVWTYLQFLSLAFVLCSLYGISYFFDWRILNTYAIFITTICIIFVNITYYMPIFEPFRVKINDFGFLEILSRHIEEPLLFTANTFFGIIFIAAGCIKYILHKVNKQKA